MIARPKVLTMMRAAASLLWLALFSLGACKFDLTDPNAPPPIGPNPSRTQVAAAALGLLIGARSDAANWVLKSAILGREGYRLDPADPRFVTELLGGPLDPGSRAFGGGQWLIEYQAIKSGYNLLNVLGTAAPAQVSPTEQNAVQGYVQTMQAYEFLMVLGAHTEDSIPIDVNRTIDQPLAPFVTNAAAYSHVVDLLDSAKTALQSGGTAFPFSLPSGFAGFDTPPTFLKFNRALMARVQAYRASPAPPGVNCATCWDDVLTALGESFVDQTASLDLGVYHTFTAASGDQVNTLAQDPASAINVVHPFVRDSAELQTGGVLRDKRFLVKTTARAKTLSGGGTPPLSSNLSWIRYPSPISAIPIIRNEELILLRAEANWFGTTGTKTQAIADLNTIRQTSGNLPATTVTTSSTGAEFVGALLHERLYSLLYEGGHRWIDMRRYGRVDKTACPGCAIIIDRPTVDHDPAFSTLPIQLNEVLARR